MKLNATCSAVTLQSESPLQVNVNLQLKNDSGAAMGSMSFLQGAGQAFAPGQKFTISLDAVAV